MNYIIIIVLICFNLFSIGLKPKKNKDELEEEINNYNRNRLYKILNRINIGIILINIITVIISIICSSKDLIAHIIFLIGLIASYAVAITKKPIYKPKYNILKKEDKYFISLVTNVLYGISLVDRVGHIKENSIGTYLSLFGIIFFILNILVLLKYLNDHKSICKFNIKPEDKIIEINDSKYIETKNILSYIIIGLVIILVIFVNIPFAAVLYTLIGILALVMYNNDVNKITKNKKELYNNIINMHQKPGTLYIYQYKRHIETTKSIVLFLIIFVISLLSFYMIGEMEFLILAMNLYTIVIYTLLNNKKKNIDNIYSLNEDLIDKDKYKVNIRNQITEVIDYQELFVINNFYKVIYKDDNNNVYISDNVLYNLKGIENEVNIYIDTTNMYNYIVVEDNYY